MVLADYKGNEKMNAIVICDRCDSVYLINMLKCPVCEKKNWMGMKIEAAKIAVEMIILDCGNVEIRRPKD